MLEFSTIREKLDIYFNFQFLYPFSIFCCIIHILLKLFREKWFPLHATSPRKYDVSSKGRASKGEQMEKMCSSLGIFYSRGMDNGAFKSRFGYLDILKV